jgi:hypothetical protein
VLSMAIAYREKVAVSQSQEVGTRYVSVLIDFVGVVCTKTCLGSERKLCNYICYLRS